MKWFTLSGLKEEIRKIEWPKRKENVSNTFTVLAFVGFFAVFFIAAEFLISAFLKVVGAF
ncbi:preprotein translocase subunit SecE [Erysipelothrix larvae]|uniref:Preprotein translocase subunit SecE n=1 Tax=Erysipelothrix larvae TaxID=1514105 RepID=A0A109UGJ0_9FIRM|nr:preprotein translocase subunit SecE [Erysipelothrix larvae]AMC92731.1 preprotein translocase subunit SecE [Erysipelothrix larvae]